MKEEFMECDTCRAKPGTPILCDGCLHNRAAIESLNKRPPVSRHWELRPVKHEWDGSGISNEEIL